MPLRFKNLTASSLLILGLVACSDVGTDAGAQAEINMSNLMEEPPIWSVTDEDSEIILYPTFHILPEGVTWKTDRLTAALDRAEEIWYEIPVGSDQDPALQQMTMQLGMSPDRPLSTVLSEETYGKLETAAESLGLPVQNIESFRPWMVSIMLPVMQMMQSGYNPQLGVESQLQMMVTDKPTKAFETAEQQLRFFADMSEEDQILMLESTLEDIDLGKEMIDRMAAAWSSGDMEMLETEIVDGMKVDYPVLYNVMFKNRNTAWAETLDLEMQGSGVDFVAVGAGHLIGEDSVPQMLLERGYKVEVLTQEK